MFVHVRDEGNPNDMVPLPDPTELQDLSQAEQMQVYVKPRLDATKDAW